MKDRIVAAALAICLVACLSRGALAQTPPNGASATSSGKHKTAAPSLTVTLIDAEQKAPKHSATVSVQVHGIRLVDPASAKEKPVKGQGHLHYRVDNGPIIATTATKLSFHELGDGPHSFTVSLAANDHSALGPTQTVNVNIP